MATVGSALISPETGWQRIDDTNANITYIGTGWSTSSYSNASEWNGAVHCSMGDTGEIRFNFTGSNLRIIDTTGTVCPSDIKVYIDDVLNGTFSQVYGSFIYRRLGYQVLNLTNAEHRVRLVSETTGKYFFLDAIDIDSAGIIKAYNENISTFSYYII